MSISLTKGEALSLTKDAGFSKIRVGLGWSLVKGQPLDLDVCAFLLNNDKGKPICTSPKHFVFFNNLQGPGVIHNGDNRTGAGEGDDETIDIDFNVVESQVPSVDEISILVTIYQARMKKQSFGGVSEAYVNIYNAANNSLIANYKLNESFPDKFSVQIGSFVKNGPGKWEFQAIGVGFSQEIGDVVAKYGLNN